MLALAHGPGFSQSAADRKIDTIHKKAVDTAGSSAADTLRFQQLKDVNVTGSRRVIQASKGKLVFNVEQSPSAAGSSALELLQQMPGISLDQDENLLLKGAAAGNVMVDGKRMYLSAQQLSNLLKGMPSENIGRIELITTPGAQYDAAGNTGIINIITRKSSRPGYAATLSGGLGLGHTLLNTQNFSGNIRTRTFNLFGNLSYSYRPTFRRELNYQAVSGNGQTTFYDRDLHDEHNSRYYSYKLGIDFYLTKKQELGVVYTGSLDDWKKFAGGPTLLRDGQGNTGAILLSDNMTKEPYVNNAFNINYTYAIDSLGKLLTADADYVAYRNHSDGYLADSTIDPGGHILMPYQRLNFHQPSNIDIRSVKSDLVLPMKQLSLKAGLKYSSVTIDNNFRYDSLIAGARVFSPSLSDHFVYTEKIAAAYLTLGHHWKYTDLEAGLRIEHTLSEGNSISTDTIIRRSYANLFPFLSLDWQLDRRQKLNLSVSRRINRPGYGELNPARYYYDQYSYSQGNPNLLPETAWLFSLTYTLLDKYIATFSCNLSEHFIARNLLLDTHGGAQISRNVNFPHREQYEALFIIPITVSSGYSLNLISDATYTWYPLPVAGGSTIAGRLTEDIRLNQTFTIPGAGMMEIVANYTSPELYGAYLQRHYFSVDGGLKKALTKKVDLRLSFTDLFHTIRYAGYTIDPVNYNSYARNWDSRRIRLTLVCRLGGKLTGGKARVLEEQNRLN